jgi:hypothetical protein
MMYATDIQCNNIKKSLRKWDWWSGGTWSGNDHKDNIYPADAFIWINIMQGTAVASSTVLFETPISFIFQR